ncbi:MAG: hypothetical protein ISS52_05155 [Dehalococcoidia bacterium]|nr:hypothetical protein [Dehalococcoidia bacterium]
MSQEGTKVVVNDYFADRAKAVADGIKADVKEEAEVVAVVKEASEKSGEVNILLNKDGVLTKDIQPAVILRLTPLTLAYP